MTEADYTQDGFVSSISPDKGTIGTARIGDEDAASVTVTNHRPAGGLTIQKAVTGSGASENDMFTFRLTLVHNSVTVDGEYTATRTGEASPFLLTVSGGVATVTLHGNQSITIEGIPTGTSYTVEELVTNGGVQSVAELDKVNENGYALIETSGTAGTIQDGVAIVIAKLTNERKVGDLTVEKVVAGNGAGTPNALEAFDITVKFTAPEGVALTGTVNGQPVQEEQTITLESGASVTFTGLPENTTYEVTETDYSQNGYTTAYTNPTGTILARETASAGVTATVINTLNVGGLTIEKTLGGNAADAEKEFSFTVTLKNESVEINKTYGGVEFTAVNGNNHEAEATLTLKGGESATMSGIPAGTSYTVEEANYRAEGYVTTIPANAEGRIVVDETPTVTFLNTRNTGNLTVEKVVAGNGAGTPNALEAFDITVKFSAPQGVTLTGTVNGQPVQEEQTITLESGETVAFTGLPEGTSYEVSETDYSQNGYTTAYTNQTGTIAASDAAAAGVTATVTNTLNVGNLTVTKTLGGNAADTEKEFSFTVTLKNESVEINKTYGGVEFTAVNGNNHEVVATLTLKGGESATMSGIPAGTSYTVEEADYKAEGYVTTIPANAEGGIVANETATVTFLNTRNTGNLTVQKIVAGTGVDSPNAQIPFAITVYLTAPEGVNLSGEVNGEPVQAEQTFTVNAGESIRFTGLPEGTAYEVVEEPIDAAYGFETPVYANEQGTVAASAQDAVGITATVTNTIHAGNLSISKTVNGSGAQTDKAFNFELTLVNNGGVNVDNTYAVTGTDLTTLTVEGGRASFTLTHGQTITIYGIPVGTNYIVTEVDPDSELEGYLADGYVTQVNGSDGVTAAGYNLTSAGATVAFTNTRDVGELTVSKTVAGAIGETDKAFDFEVTLVSGNNGVPVDGTYSATLYTHDEPTAVTVRFENGIAEFSLTDAQSMVIHEIPAGTRYIVRESSYALDGYQTEMTGETGTIPATGNMPAASFINTRNAGNLIVEKVLAGNAPIADDSFEFTITLNRTDGVNVDGAYEALRNGEPIEDVIFENGVATVTLTGGDTLEIAGILSGTTYEVVENLPEYTDYDLAGSNGDTGTIPVDAAATATFTNMRNVGSLTLRKTVAGNAGETNRDFSFTVFMRDRYGRNVNGVYAMSGDAGTSITFTDGYATIRLSSGEQATITGILAGTYYSVSENEANTDDYVTTSSGSTGIIAADGTAQAAFTNTRNVVLDEYTSRTVYKIWNDENDADGIRPDTLTVYLMADGQSVAQATLSEDNDWSTVFANLPVYNADGTEIVYRVVEAVTADYYVRYQYGDAVVNITNTHNPDRFTPTTPDDPELLTLIEDNMVPLGGNINMNEGDCFN